MATKRGAVPAFRHRIEWIMPRAGWRRRRWQPDCAGGSLTHRPPMRGHELLPDGQPEPAAIDAAGEIARLTEDLEYVRECHGVDAAPGIGDGDRHLPAFACGPDAHRALASELDGIVDDVEQD